jgi:hypothetical protein
VDVDDGVITVGGVDYVVTVAGEGCTTFVVMQGVGSGCVAVVVANVDDGDGEEAKVRRRHEQLWMDGVDRCTYVRH